MHYRTFVGNYRQIMKYERLNVCELVEKDLRSPSTPMEYIFNGIDTLAPNLLQKCPFKGKITVTNYTYPSSWATLQPKGDFILVNKLYDDVDTDGMEFKIFFSIKVRTGDDF